MPAGEPRETSFYEVSLTNRQVMVAFAFLLVGLLVAFLSGVWVGKTASPPAVAQEAALRVVEQEPATAPGPTPAEPTPGEPTNGPGTGAAQGAAPAEEVPRLDYFQESEAPLSPPSSAPAAPPFSQPAPGTQPTAANPPAPTAAGPGAKPVPQAKPKWQQRRELANEAERLESEFAREEAELEDAPAASVPASGARPAAPLPAGARSPAPTPSTSPQVVPPAAAPTPPVTRPAGTQFLVQVFSSPDPVKAREMLTSLQDAGYPASLSRSELASGVTYRVRIGPYRDRTAAQKVADDVRRKMRVDTWITTE